MSEEDEKPEVLRRKPEMFGFLGVCEGLASYYDFQTLPLRLLFLMFWMVSPWIAFIIYMTIGFGFMEAPDVNSDG